MTRDPQTCDLGFRSDVPQHMHVIIFLLSRRFVRFTSGGAKNILRRHNYAHITLSFFHILSLGAVIQNDKAVRTRFV